MCWTVNWIAPCLIYKVFIHSFIGQSMTTMYVLHLRWHQNMRPLRCSHYQNFKVTRSFSDRIMCPLLSEALSPYTIGPLDICITTILVWCNLFDQRNKSPGAAEITRDWNRKSRAWCWISICCSYKLLRQQFLCLQTQLFDDMSSFPSELQPIKLLSYRWVTRKGHFKKYIPPCRYFVAYWNGPKKHPCGPGPMEEEKHVYQEGPLKWPCSSDCGNTLIVIHTKACYLKYMNYMCDAPKLLSCPSFVAFCGPFFDLLF